MAGIRQKKQARTQEDILRSAAYLIGKKGYARTTMEDIAARAEVGVGTVYNYFGSKNELLLALMSRDTEQLLQQGQDVLAHPGDRPERALSELFWVYVSGLVAKYDRKMLREVFAAAFSQPQSLGMKMTGLDFQLMAQVTQLLEKFQSRGVLRKSLSLDQAALVLYASFAMPVMMYVLYDDMSVEALREQMGTSINLIFRSWREEEGGAEPQAPGRVPREGGA
jgi:AcrR family transcriptional regulator